MEYWSRFFYTVARPDRAFEIYGTGSWKQFLLLNLSLYGFLGGAVFYLEAFYPPAIGSMPAMYGLGKTASYLLAVAGGFLSNFVFLVPAAAVSLAFFGLLVHAVVILQGHSGIKKTARAVSFASASFATLAQLPGLVAAVPFHAAVVVFFSTRHEGLERREALLCVSPILLSGIFTVYVFLPPG
ncbi:MAG: hypothetical protein ABEJ64_03760 [Candidatus Nanohaloarchaea archaeon]